MPLREYLSNMRLETLQQIQQGEIQFRKLKVEDFIAAKQIVGRTGETANAYFRYQTPLSSLTISVRTNKDSNQPNNLQEPLQRLLCNIFTFTRTRIRLGWKLICQSMYLEINLHHNSSICIVAWLNDSLNTNCLDF